MMWWIKEIIKDDGRELAIIIMVVIFLMWIF
jgi:hypothetical protein